MKSGIAALAAGLVCVSSAFAGQWVSTGMNSDYYAKYNFAYSGGRFPDDKFCTKPDEQLAECWVSNPALDQFPAYGPGPTCKYMNATLNSDHYPQGQASPGLIYECKR